MENTIKEFKIEAEEPEITYSTTYYHLDLTINNKSVAVSRYVSIDDNMGVTADEVEIIGEDSEELTEEEKEAVIEYCNENVRWD